MCARVDEGEGAACASLRARASVCARARMLARTDLLYIDLLYMDLLYMDLLYMVLLYMDLLYIDLLYIDLLYMDLLYIDLLGRAQVRGVLEYWEQQVELREVLSRREEERAQAIEANQRQLNRLYDEMGLQRDSENEVAVHDAQVDGITTKLAEAEAVCRAWSRRCHRLDQMSGHVTASLSRTASILTHPAIVERAAPDVKKGLRRRGKQIDDLARVLTSMPMPPAQPPHTGAAAVGEAAGDPSFESFVDPQVLLRELPKPVLNLLGYEGKAADDLIHSHDSVTESTLCVAMSSLLCTTSEYAIDGLTLAVGGTDPSADAVRTAEAVASAATRMLPTNLRLPLTPPPPARATHELATRWPHDLEETEPPHDIRAGGGDELGRQTGRASSPRHLSITESLKVLAPTAASSHGSAFGSPQPMSKADEDEDAEAAGYLSERLAAKKREDKILIGLGLRSPPKPAAPTPTYGYVGSGSDVLPRPKPVQQPTPPMGSASGSLVSARRRGYHSVRSGAEPPPAPPPDVPRPPIKRRKSSVTGASSYRTPVPRGMMTARGIGRA